MRLTNKRLTEQAITDYLTSQYGGSEDEEVRRKKRFGLKYELEVRKGEGAETHWISASLWFVTSFKRAAVYQRITSGQGTLGQQHAKGRLRDLKFVDITK